MSNVMGSPWLLPLERFTEEACAVWRKLSHAPTLISGRLSSRTDQGQIGVRTLWSQCRVEAKDRSLMLRHQLVSVSSDGTSISKIWDAPPVLKAKTRLESVSPSGKFRAEIIVRKDEKTGDEIQELLVLDSECIVFHLDLLAQKKHGVVCGSEQFGVLAWSHSEDQLLFIADEKAPKTESFFPTTLDASSLETDKSSPAAKGDEYLYRDNWGEQLYEYHKTVLVLVDWRKCEIRVLDGAPEDVSVGQAVWAPDDSGVVFIGWKHQMPRLGLIYCTQRLSAVYHLTLDGHCEQLNSGAISVRFPQFSPSGDKLMYLEQDEGGPHHASGRLMMIDWSTKVSSLIVDTVRRATGDEFPGLFKWSSVDRCWGKNGHCVVMDTQWRSRQELIRVDVATQSVSRLSPADSPGNWSLLDLVEDVILASFSSPSTPPKLMIGILPSNADQPVQWTPLTSSTEEPLKWDVLTLAPTVGDSSLSYEAVLCQPAHEKSPSTSCPLVVLPHGGPHSCFPTKYFQSVAALCRLGFAALAVNYRGSSGFGQDGIESLLGNVGTNDVSDVQIAAEHAAELVSADRDAIFVYGGSHGGFLTAHAIGQYPDFYRGACLRNPVIDITSESRLTDIPDWTYVEAGFPYELRALPTAEVYATMLKISPICYADKVKAATQIQLGTNDRRVPPHQGREFYEMLKTRGVPVKLFVYPKDCHPLDRVETEADCFINAVKWFHQHSVTKRNA